MASLPSSTEIFLSTKICRKTTESKTGAFSDRVPSAASGEMPAPRPCSGGRRAAAWTTGEPTAHSGGLSRQPSLYIPTAHFISTHSQPLVKADGKSAIPRRRGLTGRPPRIPGPPCPGKKLTPPVHSALFGHAWGRLLPALRPSRAGTLSFFRNDRASALSGRDTSALACLPSGPSCPGRFLLSLATCDALPAPVSCLWAPARPGFHPVGRGNCSDALPGLLSCLWRPGCVQGRLPPLPAPVSCLWPPARPGFHPVRRGNCSDALPGLLSCLWRPGCVQGRLHPLPAPVSRLWPPARPGFHPVRRGNCSDALPGVLSCLCMDPASTLSFCLFDFSIIHFPCNSTCSVLVSFCSVFIFLSVTLHAQYSPLAACPTWPPPSATEGQLLRRPPHEELPHGSVWILPLGYCLRLDVSLYMPSTL